MVQIYLYNCIFRLSIILFDSLILILIYFWNNNKSICINDEIKPSSYPVEVEVVSNNQIGLENILSDPFKTLYNAHK